MSGVSQCSFLGPIYFLIFINDLNRVIINWILQFIDDTKLCGVVNSIEDKERLQKYVDKIS
jgi:hypothetical protein